MRLIASISLVAFVGIALAGIAHAQPSATQPVPSSATTLQPGPPAQVDAAPSDVDEGVLDDANAGHAFLTPTALTMPAGTWAFSDDELVFVGIAYAPSDRVEIGLKTLLPVIDEMPTFGFLTAKVQVIKAGSVRVALHGAGIYFDEYSDDGGENFDRPDDSIKVLAL